VGFFYRNRTLECVKLQIIFELAMKKELRKNITFAQQFLKSDDL